MSESFEIEGGNRVEGTIRPGGNKNAALPLIAAALLTDDEVVLRNVPEIRDVKAQLDLLEALGVQVTRPEPNSVTLCAASVGDAEPDPELCGRIRASVRAHTICRRPPLRRRPWRRSRRHACVSDVTLTAIPPRLSRITMRSQSGRRLYKKGKSRLCSP